MWYNSGNMSEKIGESYKDGMVIGVHTTGRDLITRVIYDNGTPDGNVIDFVARPQSAETSELPKAGEVPNE